MSLTLPPIRTTTGYLLLRSEYPQTDANIATVSEIEDGSWLPTIIILIIYLYTSYVLVGL